MNNGPNPLWPAKLKCRVTWAKLYFTQTPCPGKAASRGPSEELKGIGKRPIDVECQVDAPGGAPGTVKKCGKVYHLKDNRRYPAAVYTHLESEHKLTRSLLEVAFKDEKRNLVLPTCGQSV